MNIYSESRKHPELWLGSITWLIVAAYSLTQWHNGTTYLPPVLEYSPVNLIFAVFCFLLYAVGLFTVHLKRKKMPGFALSAVTLIALMLQFNNGFILILAIIFISDLSQYIKFRYTIVLSVTIPFSYFPMVLEQDVWINSSLFTCFNLFAVMINQKLRAEKQAKEHAAHLVRELKATQQLLSTTSKRDERLRIARDLHDVMGHHLTALSLQLEVALQLPQQQSTQHIAKAQDISRLLLSDVRNAVSELRVEQALEINRALNQLINDIEGIKVTLHTSDNIKTYNARVAEAIFRVVQEALTNVLKHSNASECQIELYRVGYQLTLTISDNGSQPGPLNWGNGLNGMQERITALDGNMSITNNEQGCQLTITLPDAEDYL